MSRAQQAVARALSRIEGVHGVSVTYTRAAGSPQEQTLAPLVVIPGRHTEANAQPAGMPAGGDLTYSGRDFTVTVARLAPLGPPREGDRITQDGYVFEVKPPGTGEPAWRFSDQTQVSYRLHTKLMRKP